MWQGEILGLSRRNDSQRRRLALFRSTAFGLNFLPHTTPHLVLESGVSETTATKRRALNFLPPARTWSKSAFNFSLSPGFRESFNASPRMNWRNGKTASSRAFEGKRRKLASRHEEERPDAPEARPESLGLGELLTALGATPAQNRAASACGHAGAESAFALSLDLRRLIGSLHWAPQPFTSRSTPPDTGLRRGRSVELVSSGFPKKRN